VAEIGFVTVYWPLRTTGAGDTVDQVGDAGLVADWRVKPVESVGQDRRTFWADGVIVSDGRRTGSEKLNTVPLPKVPPRPAVPYRTFPDKVNPAAGLAPSLLVGKDTDPIGAVNCRGL
jgi:hypothetical protein